MATGEGTTCATNGLHCLRLRLVVWGGNVFVCFVLPSESLETFSAETIQGFLAQTFGRQLGSMSQLDGVGQREVSENSQSLARDRRVIEAIRTGVVDNKNKIINWEQRPCKPCLGSVCSRGPWRASNTSLKPGMTITVSATANSVGPARVCVCAGRHRREVWERGGTPHPVRPHMEHLFRSGTSSVRKGRDLLE